MNEVMVMIIKTVTCLALAAACLATAPIALAQTGGEPPHRAILGCTHFPLVEALFRTHLPAFTRVLPQPEVVADSLEDYLNRHPRYAGESVAATPPLLLTTGDPAHVNRIARIFWPDAPAFAHLAT